jgi:hypothetical protein
MGGDKGSEFVGQLGFGTDTGAGNVNGAVKYTTKYIRCVRLANPTNTRAISTLR